MSIASNITGTGVAQSINSSGVGTLMTGEDSGVIRIFIKDTIRINNILNI